MVSDLIEEKPEDSGYFLTCCLYHNRLIALDGGNGKILFDTAKNKKDFIEKYYPGNISAMWVEMREWNGHSPGYGPQLYQPVLMVFVDHNSWITDIPPQEVTPEQIVGLLEIERISETKRYNNLSAKQKDESWGKYHSQRAAIFKEAVRIITDHYKEQEEPSNNGHEKESGKGT